MALLGARTDSLHDAARAGYRRAGRAGASLAGSAVTQRTSSSAFARLTSIAALEQIVTRDGVGALLGELRALVRSLADDPPRRELVALLADAVERERGFLKDHPDALFQRLWYRCWWYDCPHASPFYRAGAFDNDPPLVEPLHRLLERWRARKRHEASTETPRYWLRSLRPPDRRLGGRPLATRKIAEGRALAFSPDGARLLLDTGTTRHAWDWQRDVVSSHPQETPRPPSRVSLVDTIRELLRERGWRLAEGPGELPEALAPYQRWTIEQAVLSPDGRRFALRGHTTRDDDVDAWREVRVTLWSLDVIDGALRLRDDVRVPWVGPLEFSPDSRHLVIVEDGGVVLWPTERGDRVRHFEVPRDRVERAAMSPDGQLLAACTARGYALVWPCSRPRPRAGSVFAQTLGAPQFSPEGARLLMSPVLTDGRTGAFVATIRDTVYGGGGCEGGPPVNWRAVGDTRIASMTVVAQVWDATTGSPIPTPDQHRFHQLQEHLAYSPDLEFYAVNRFGSPEVVIRELVSGVDVAKFRCASVTCMKFSPDGATLAIGTTRPRVTIFVIDFARKRRVATLVGHEQPVTDITFGRDGATLVSYAPNDSLRLWELAGERELAARPLPHDPALEGYRPRLALYHWLQHGHLLRPSQDLLGELDGWCGVFRSPERPRPWIAIERDGLLCVRARAGDEDDRERDHLIVARFPLVDADSQRWRREPASSPVPRRHPDGDIWVHDHVHVKLERF